MTLRSFFLRATAALVLLGSSASPAMAHGDLKSSIPADKSSIAMLLKELRLVFTERPELPLTKIVLRAPDGTSIPLGKLVASGADKATITAQITGVLSAPGLYTVEWEMAGEDGHPMDGKFTFTIRPEAFASAAPVVPTDTARATADTQMAHHDTVSMPTSAERFDAQSGGYVVVRFVLYTAMLMVIGAVAFRWAVLAGMSRRADADRAFIDAAATRAAAVGGVAVVVLVAAIIARLVAQRIALNGIDLGTLLSSTKWGRGWLTQLVAALVALAGLWLARRGTPGGWTIAALGAVVLAFTPAISSHAAASNRSGAFIADGLHVLGASGWLGSLAIVLLAGIPTAMLLAEGRRGTAVADLINAFSPTALVFAGIVAASGLFAAWIHLGGVSPLWQSTYGRILLAKLAVLSVVALTGAYNWLRVKPALGTDEGASRIRRSASVEVGVGVFVLLLTAILVATPTPMDRM